MIKRNSSLMRNNLVWVGASILTLILLAGLEWLARKGTQGVLMYPLDDPFIHMQIARRWAESGTWGINPGEFGSASSSLLYTILLATCFKIFGVHTFIPLLLNIVAAILLLWRMDRWLQNKNMELRARIGLIGLLVIFIPLPVMVMSGMEHLIQLLLAFLFLSAFSDACEKEGDIPVPAPVYLWALLSVAVRFEGLFLVAGAGLWLAWHRKWVRAFLLGLVSLIPVLLFGMISVSKGSFFLPNSVLLKAQTTPGGLGQIGSFIANILIEKWTVVKGQSVSPSVPPPGISLLATQRLLLLLPVLYLFLVRQSPRNPKKLSFVFVLTITTLLHLALASTGWFYRYEAYLIGLSLLALGWVAVDDGKMLLEKIRGNWISTAMGILIAFAVLFPFVLRISAAYTKAPRACINIYEQQYQMARWVKENGDWIKTIALNDIGAVSFYNEKKVIDLWGLANITVAKSRKGGYNSPSFMDSLVKKEKVDLIIIYNTWFPETLHSRWHPIGEWTVSNNVILGGETVTFYVVDPAKIELGVQRLQQFEKQLPKGIVTAYPEILFDQVPPSQP